MKKYQELNSVGHAHKPPICGGVQLVLTLRLALDVNLA